MQAVKVHNALHTQSDGFHTWLAVALSRQKAAELEHQAHYLIERGQLARDFLLVQNVGRFSLVGLEAQLRVQVHKCAPGT